MCWPMLRGSPDKVRWLSSPPGTLPDSWTYARRRGQSDEPRTGLLAAWFSNPGISCYAAAITVGFPLGLSGVPSPLGLVAVFADLVATDSGRKFVQDGGRQLSASAGILRDPAPPSRCPRTGHTLPVIQTPRAIDRACAICPLRITRWDVGLSGLYHLHFRRHLGIPRAVMHCPPADLGAPDDAIRRTGANPADRLPACRRGQTATYTLGTGGLMEPWYVGANCTIPARKRFRTRALPQFCWPEQRATR